MYNTNLNLVNINKEHLLSYWRKKYSEATSTQPIGNSNKKLQVLLKIIQEVKKKKITTSRVNHEMFFFSKGVFTKTNNIKPAGIHKEHNSCC